MCKSTKQIIALLSQTDFIQELADRGYSWLTITSKTGHCRWRKG